MSARPVSERLSLRQFPAAQSPPTSFVLRNKVGEVQGFERNRSAREPRKRK